MNLITRIIVAALAAAAFAAHAAHGFSVTRSQQAAVRIGMTSDEVRQVLGRPAQVFVFRNSPGPSWIYRTTIAGDSVFEIEFGADGRVISARERIIPAG